MKVAILATALAATVAIAAPAEKVARAQNSPIQFKGADGVVQTVTEGYVTAANSKGPTDDATKGDAAQGDATKRDASQSAEKRWRGYDWAYNYRYNYPYPHYGPGYGPDFACDLSWWPCGWDLRGSWNVGCCSGGWWR